MAPLKHRGKCAWACSSWQLAAELGVSVGTAQRMAVAVGLIPRTLEQRVLELHRAEHGM
jgi:hypothetical protein